MQFTDTQVAELRIGFNAWRAIEQIEGRPFPDKDDDTFKIIAARATKYGALQGARSAWTRAAQELAGEGVITLRKPAPRPVEVTREFRLKVAAMSSSEVRTTYRRDPEFRKQWDAMALEDDGGTVRQVAEADEPVELTALQYRSMDPNVLARLLQAPGTREKWQAAINKLIAAGSI